ncbi:predicted protein [Sparassis crispa]|uniref:HAUS augmin-like complex subunit 6 N-terminal domain-containing protein n=1 Tax=Sparassis crispa TaxID=139825 RepID=A0A401GVX1_9APHY|nr:predicted protein [Sparassis crispa]GBE86319.1 predicted protein [Sparassis crispa]
MPPSNSKSTITALPVALPHSLLVLVHLHLLDYPLKQAAQYDERLFNSKTNGIRERTKAMEDICYFLLGRIEGRDRAKAILPMYPCLQPSDTTAFRVSLTKYLESLRHGIVHTNHKVSNSDNKGKMRDSTDTAGAWWWKDVVVRKSLLEECAGERFERLLLALSTHALFKKLSASPALSAEPGREELTALTSTYGALLAQSHSSRRVWERTASALTRRKADLQLLRERLSDPNANARRSTKYNALTTDRLLALRDSALSDLLRKSWRHAEGLIALDFLIDLAGLQGSHGASKHDGENSSRLSIVAVDVLDTKAPVALPIPPLPIAAAHHPAHLHTLMEPVFSSSTPTAPMNATVSAPARPKETIPFGVSERIDAAARMEEALQRALASAEAVRQQLQKRIQGGKAIPASNKSVLNLDLRSWAAPNPRTLDFHTAPTPGLLGTFSLPSVSPESALEEQIAQIRTALLPAYPPVPTQPVLCSDPLPVPVPPSRLRQPAQIGEVKALRRGAAGMSVNSGLARATSAHLRFAQEDAAASTQRNVHPRIASRRVSRRVRRSLAVRDEEVDKVVEAVRGESASFEVAEATPAHVGRTAGVPLSAVKSVPRPSYDMERHERAINVPLPRLRLSGADEDAHSEDDIPRHRSSEGGKAWTNNNWPDVKPEEEEYYEGQSITLKEILLKAGSDAAQFDLLGDSEDDLDEDFEWE